MRKVSFVQTVIRFHDVYNNFYCERFICRSFLSYSQIRDLSDAMLNNLPDNRIDWSSFGLKMRFVNLTEYV